MMFLPPLPPSKVHIDYLQYLIKYGNVGCSTTVCISCMSVSIVKPLWWLNCVTVEPPLPLPAPVRNLVWNLISSTTCYHWSQSWTNIIQFQIPSFLRPLSDLIVSTLCSINIFSFTHLGAQSWFAFLFCSLPSGQYFKLT